MEQRPPFHEQLRFERERRGWSQADLAEKTGCDAKTVGRWESGERLPRPYHRQLLCELFGKNAEELGLTGMMPKALPVSARRTARVAAQAGENSPLSPLLEDWDEAPVVTSLHGREKECGELERWLEDQRCQVITVLGMGGMGKTALVETAATHVKESFHCIFWRSLQNAPPVELIVKKCLRFLSQQLPADLPENVDELLPLLLPYLRSRRCLVVLDNAESIMQAGQRASRYREGYAAYGKLIKFFGETQHQSCLVLTSREKPKEVVRLEGKTTPVRTLSLTGIEQSAGQELLQERVLFGSDEEWAALIECYSGNPLALQLVSEPIQEVFGGDIARFLQEDVSVFGDVSDLLEQHFHRLSDGEREIMYWLAIEREVVPLDELREDLAEPIAAGLLPEILASLRRRSMIETRGSAHFTLQPVIMEYVTGRLVERAFQEFVAETMGIWMSHALIKAKSKDYTRESQVRLLIAPLAQRLLAALGKRAVEQRAKNLLATQRQGDIQHPGYLAGNILNLLSYARCSLRGFDFSHLTVRQAYLLNVPLPDVNFAHAHFVATVFTSTFGNVYAIAYSPQKNLLAVGTSTGDIWLYHVLRGTFLLTCQGHSDGVWSVAFSPDGRMLASGSDDQTVRLWDSDTGLCFHVLRDHANRVRAVTFGPDGKLLASGSDDATIRLWDAGSGRCLKTLQGHADRVWCVAFAPGGKHLATGSTDQTVRVWDVSGGNCISVLQDHSNWVRSIAFHPDGSQLASASDDQTVRVWDANTGRCLKTLHGHTNRVWSTAFSPGGQTIASSSDDQSIRLWDSGTGYCLRTLQGYTNRVWCITFEPGGAMLASVGEDQQIRLWDVRSGACVGTMQERARGSLVIAFNPGGHTLASGGQDQVVRIWDVISGRCVQMLRGHTNWIRTVAFSPDGKLLASGDEDQTIRLWESKTGDCLNVLRGHTSRIRSVAFSPAGHLLASGSEDQTIRLWESKTGDCLNVLRGHTSRIRSVAFSPAGHLLASCSDDGTIKLWNAQASDCLKTLTGERPYEGMNITASQGLTEAQKASLRELGAVES